MRNKYLHLVLFDLKLLVFNRLTAMQTLFLQAFLAHFFLKQFPGLEAAGDGVWPVYTIAAGLFVLNTVNFFSFEFIFAKVRRHRIAENLFAAPVNCRAWLYSAAAACFLFNAANLAVHLGVITVLTGRNPLSGLQLAALASVWLFHAGLVLALGLASLRTAVYATANMAIFIGSVFGMTAFGFFGGFGLRLEPALALRLLAGTAAFFAAAAALTWHFADPEKAAA